MSENSNLIVGTAEVLLVLCPLVLALIGLGLWLLFRTPGGKS